MLREAARPRPRETELSLRSQPSTRPPHPSRLGAAARPRPRRRAGRSIRRRSPRCRRCSAIASAARDLLIEHLHLLQDHFGCLHARHLVALGRGDAAGAGRGLRGRLVLRPFRHRHGRRGAAAAGHGAGLRQPHLRAVRRRSSCSSDLRDRLGDGVRVVRAPCMGGCDNGAGRRDRPRAARARHRRQRRRRRSRPAHTHPEIPAYPGLDALPRRRRLSRCCEACLAGERTPRRA